MENSSSDNNNTSILSRRPKLTSADHGNNNNDETPEESSWTMYFEDFFKDSNGAEADDNCDDSSFISDAASFVGIKKINVSKDPSVLPKKRRCKDVPLVGHDLEDTASSPSRSPNNVFSMMNLLDNKRDKGVSDTTRHEKGNISAGQDNEGGLSMDLKKKGLCLVPLSMFADYHV